MFENLIQIRNRHRRSGWCIAIAVTIIIKFRALWAKLERKRERKSSSHAVTRDGQSPDALFSKMILVQHHLLLTIPPGLLNGRNGDEGCSMVNDIHVHGPQKMDVRSDYPDFDLESDEIVDLTFSFCSRSIWIIAMYLIIVYRFSELYKSLLSFCPHTSFSWTFVAIRNNCFMGFMWSHIKIHNFVLLNYMEAPRYTVILVVCGGIQLDHGWLSLNWVLRYYELTDLGYVFLVGVQWDHRY